MPQRILWARLQSGIEAQPLGHFLNCVGAQFTCPDCTSMTAAEVKGAECEVRSDDGVTVTLSAPPIGEDAIYTPAAATSIDNCVVRFLLLILSRAWLTRMCCSTNTVGNERHVDPVLCAVLATTLQDSASVNQCSQILIVPTKRARMQLVAVGASACCLGHVCVSMQGLL